METQHKRNYCKLLLTINLVLSTAIIFLLINLTVIMNVKLKDLKVTKTINENFVEIITPTKKDPIETIPEKPIVEETEPVTEIPDDTTIQESEETTEPPNTIDQMDLEYLACIIFKEAGADNVSDLSRKRVADVVLNRVADSRFPNTIYEVLVDPGQYGYSAETGVYWPSTYKDPLNAHAVERAYRIAEEVLSGNHSDLYGKGYIWQAAFVQGTDNICSDNIIFGR